MNDGPETHLTNQTHPGNEILHFFQGQKEFFSMEKKNFECAECGRTVSARDVSRVAGWLIAMDGGDKPMPLECSMCWARRERQMALAPLLGLEFPAVTMQHDCGVEL